MNKTNDSVKFAIIEMKESFGSLNVGSRHKSLVYKDVCVIIDGLIGFSYPLTFQENKFKVIEFISGNAKEDNGKICGFNSSVDQRDLMFQRMLDEKDARIRDLKETLRPFLTSRMQIVENEIKIL